MKKILLVYAVDHSGHAQVAHALSEALPVSGRWEPVEDNIIHYFPQAGPLFMKLYKWVIFHRSEIWGHFHDNPNYESLARVFEEMFYKMDLLRVEKILKRHKPDVILATHAFPLRALAALKAEGKVHAPLYALTTDFWAHRYWAHEAVDHYFASSAQARMDLISHGVAAKRISITGIPIREDFLKAMPRERALGLLKFQADKKTILVMGGSYGVVPFGELLDAAQNHTRLRNHQWIFIFGNNRKGLTVAKKHLKPENAGRVRLLGFTSEVASLMAASDLMVGKGGALTASEALAVGLPMVISRPVAGQETKNADFLVRSGAARRADSKDKLLSLLVRLTSDDRLLRSMRVASKNISTPCAASNVLDILDKTWT